MDISTLRAHIDFKLITVGDKKGKIMCTARDSEGERLLPLLETTYKTELEMIRSELELKDEMETKKFLEKQAKIDAIEGLNDLILAYLDIKRYRAEFEAMMDDEFNDGACMPEPPKADINALKKRYPRADAYLKALDWSNSENYAKSKAGDKALERIIDGEDYTLALTDMDAEWGAYCREHMWD